MTREEAIKMGFNVPDSNIDVVIVGGVSQPKKKPSEKK
jgi:hypothetical protein